LPTTFVYNGKRYTPRSFADNLLHFTNDYLELVSFGDKPLYQNHVLVDRYNWANDSFYNISLADMQMVVDSALARGWSLGWEGDVTETGFDTFAGFAALDNLPDSVDDKRLANYKNLSTERDHMLHLVGAGYDSLGKRWYYHKNSWGNYNPFKGYLYMDENYFLYKTVILFVNKAALTPSLRARLGMGR
jgi:bleomycin hydrolase